MRKNLKFKGDELSNDSQKELKKVDFRELTPLIIEDAKEGKTHFLRQIEQYIIKNKEVNFYTPNNITLALNISNKAYDLAQKMYAETIKKKLENKEINIQFKNGELSALYDFFEQAQISLIFLYTAIEAFANSSIPNNFLYEKTNSKTKVKEIWNKDNIERWMLTSEKLTEILPTIYNIQNPNQQPFWSSFKELESIRNDIIHQKTINLEVDTSYLRRFLDYRIFEIIRGGYNLLEFFCNNNNKQFFPDGLGDKVITSIVLEDFKTYFAEV
jgi:hypothetical protein